MKGSMSVAPFHPDPRLAAIAAPFVIGSIARLLPASAPGDGPIPRSPLAIGVNTTRRHMDVEVLVRRRLRTLIRVKFGSLDRFYLETGFSKGHLSEILRGKWSPSLKTLKKLARALEMDVFDLLSRETRSRKTSSGPSNL
jgi:hypothetical protein